MVQLATEVRGNGGFTAADLKKKVKAIRKYLVVGQWMRYMAVDRAMGCIDGPMIFYYGSNHNYYLYEDTTNEKQIWIIPVSSHSSNGRTGHLLRFAKGLTHSQRKILSR